MSNEWVFFFFFFEREREEGTSWMSKVTRVLVFIGQQLQMAKLIHQSGSATIDSPLLLNLFPPMIKQIKSMNEKNLDVV